MKIMLVEDNQTMFGLLEALLRMEGYQVAGVSDFGNIYTEIQEHAPDLLIMDVNLGDINGVDVLEQVRADGKLSNTPIIMSSGLDFREDCCKHGANDFIMKPYMPEELIEKIKLFIK